MLIKEKGKCIHKETEKRYNLIFQNLSAPHKILQPRLIACRDGDGKMLTGKKDFMDRLINYFRAVLETRRKSLLKH